MEIREFLQGKEGVLSQDRETMHQTTGSNNLVNGTSLVVLSLSW